MSGAVAALTSVRGTYDGEPLAVAYGEACAAGAKISRQGMALGAGYSHG